MRRWPPPRWPTAANAPTALPLPPPGQSVSQLRALRWPEGAQPQRLQARAWIEAPTGQVLLMAADRCP